MKVISKISHNHRWFMQNSPSIIYCINLKSFIRLTMMHPMKESQRYILVFYKEKPAK